MHAEDRPPLQGAPRRRAPRARGLRQRGAALADRLVHHRQRREQRVGQLRHSLRGAVRAGQNLLRGLPDTLAYVYQSRHRHAATATGSHEPSAAWW
jgi:hypothetical protein